jgi:hypothetical protein
MPIRVNKQKEYRLISVMTKVVECQFLLRHIAIFTTRTSTALDSESLQKDDEGIIVVSSHPGTDWAFGRMHTGTLIVVPKGPELLEPLEVAETTAGQGPHSLELPGKISKLPREEGASQRSPLRRRSMQWDSDSGSRT